MKKICVLPLAVLCWVAFFPVARAQYTETFTDNFQRANVAATNNGSALGTGYVISSSSSSNQAADNWTLSSDAVYDYTAGHNDELLQESLTLGSSFSVSTTFTMASISGGSGVQAGLIVDDFSGAYNSIPGLLAFVNGSGQLDVQFPNSSGTSVYTDTISSTTTGVTVNTSDPLTLTINSTGTNSFTVSLSNATLSQSYTSGTINVSAYSTWVGNSGNGGYAGLFDYAEKATFTNLTIETVPEPETGKLLLVGLCVAGAGGLLRRKVSSSRE